MSEPVTPASTPDTTPVAQESSTPAPRVSIDDLVSAVERTTDPVFQAKEDHKGVDWDAVLASSTPEQKMILANLRADYTRKLQSVAQERKAVERERTTFTQSEAYRQLQALAQAEGVEVDPYNPDSILTRMKQEIAKTMMEAFQPVVEQQAQEAQAAKLETFKLAHPDLSEHRMEIAQLLQSNEHLGLEEAYWIVKGKAETTRRTTLEAETVALREAARKAGLRVGGGARNTKPEPPASMTHPRDLYRWYKANSG